MSNQRELSLFDSLVKFLDLVFKIVAAYINVCCRLFKEKVNKNIEGQNVLITGSGHGLGREMALKFAQQGVNLALVDINVDGNEKVKKEVNSINKSIKVFTYNTDIRDEGKVAELANKVRDDLGDVDILINNAGIVQCQSFFDLSPALVERTFQVNTISHIWTIKHFLPAMIKKERGHIVAIASIAGIIGGKYLTDYWWVELQSLLINLLRDMFD